MASPQEQHASESLNLPSNPQVWWQIAALSTLWTIRTRARALWGICPTHSLRSGPTSWIPVATTTTWTRSTITHVPHQPLKELIQTLWTGPWARTCHPARRARPRTTSRSSRYWKWTHTTRRWTHSGLPLCAVAMNSQNQFGQLGQVNRRCKRRLRICNLSLILIKDKTKDVPNQQWEAL